MIKKYNLYKILEELYIKPNESRFSGLKEGLVYLSLSQRYAIAYANGQISKAHVYKGDIKDGILFQVCLDNVNQHYGGDVWISGFKDDIISDLKELKKDSEYDLSDLTRDFVNACQFDDLDDNTIDYILKYIEVDNLSIIDVIEWSNLQHLYQGYSEICLKTVPNNLIIKAEIYEDKELIKTIKGGGDEKCEHIGYHGSPLKYWKNLIN